MNDWIIKLADVEDVSAGVYVKARANIIRKGEKSPYYDEGLLAAEFGHNEIDSVYLDELKEIGLVEYEFRGNKLVLILGRDYWWFTDGPKKTNEQSDFIHLYNNLCLDYGIDNRVNYEPKELKLIKRIRSHDKWKEKLTFVFKNWTKFLKSELNVNLPTINVLSSSYYWSRIEAHFRESYVNHVGNRYDANESNNEFKFKRPSVR